ncbi:MAG: MMPL family transporter, partial [Spirochaetaceae bacterium]|nr:MMPL family transporter [Spirochaetaceae bacterium]
MDKLLGFSQKYPWAAILLLLAGGILSSVYLNKISIDTSPDSFMKKDDPARIVYDETMETFGSDTILMIYLEDENLFSVEKLGHLHELVSIFNNQTKFPGILRVESLYSTNNIKGYPQYLDNGPLMDNPPKTEKIAKETRDIALENPLLVRNLISEEGNSTVINLYLEPITTGYDKEINARTVAMVEEVLFNDETGFNRHFKVLFDIGSPYIVEQLSSTILKDLSSILPLSMLVLLLMLIITTGSLNGAILPFITSMLSILYTAGFMGAMNLPLNMLTFTVPILVIVIGSTEDVHLLSEYMEGIKKTGKRDLAVRHMCKAVGTAVFLTALTTFLGFISISINRIVVLRQFGLIAGFTMFMNPLVTFLVTPMYLKYFGKRKVRENKKDTTLLPRVINFLGQKIFILITSRSKPIVLFFTVLGLSIGAFSIFITVDNDSSKYFRKNSAIPQRISVLNEKMSGAKLFFITLRRKTVEELLSETDHVNQDAIEVVKEDDIPVFDDTIVLFQDNIMEEESELVPIEKSPDFRENIPINYLFQKPEYLRKISEIQDLLKDKYPFGNSTSIADYITLIHKEMNAGQPGNYRETPDPSDPDSENLIAQYAMNLHHDEIASLITSDWKEANIIVRHNITSTRRMQQELIKMNRDILDLLSDFDPMLEFKITGETILTNSAADTIIKSQTIGLSLLLITILLIMSILFMNVKAGLVSLLPNIFPLLILYGIMGIFKIP